MQYEQMYDLTPREFFNAVKGYDEQEQLRQREAWERMRMQTTALLQVHTKRGRKLKPTDVFKFEWDEDAIKKIPYDEDHATMGMKKLGIEGKLLHAGGL
jgi:hypothetical protein